MKKGNSNQSCRLEGGAQSHAQVPTLDLDEGHMGDTNPGGELFHRQTTFTPPQPNPSTEKFGGLDREWRVSARRRSHIERILSLE